MGCPDEMVFAGLDPRLKAYLMLLEATQEVNTGPVR